MNHADHVHLIRGGVVPGVWADFGSGAGAFTLALADLLGEGARIYSIDRDAGALNEQRAAMRARFPACDLITMNADFTRKLELPPLDGIVMANSLHFVRDKAPALALVRGYLKPGGRLVIVEYNTDRGNTWVPYPFSFESWREMAADNGFRETRLLERRPSRFLGEIYSALSLA
jgi:SAM-dependent methyltransferase